MEKKKDREKGNEPTTDKNEKMKCRVLRLFL